MLREYSVDGRVNLNAPLLEQMRGLAGRARWHMPGHKGRLPDCLTSAAIDYTEVSVTDDLYQPCAGIAQAQALAARASAAAHTIMLTNGSTAGIHAMLLATAAPGDKVILARNCHLSAVNACVLGGLNPIWIQPRMNEYALPELDEHIVIHTLEQHPDAKAILLTRPDFYGRCMPLERIAALAHAQDTLLLVDEAHGAHFNWWNNPAGAGRLGADMWVQSAHKTLPALTAGAWLNLASADWNDKVLNRVRLTQSSSPSFSVMASLDYARAYMDAYAAEELPRLISECAQVEQRLVESTRIRPAHLDWRDVSRDPTRLTLDVARLNTTGYEAARQLGEMGIDVELADERRLVLIASVMDEHVDFERLVNALDRIVGGRASVRFAGCESAYELPIAEPVMLPREAALAKTEQVEVEDCIGRVVAQSVGLYPPGIPLAVPGERLRGELVRRMLLARDAGATLFGANDGKITCVCP